MTRGYICIIGHCFFHQRLIHTTWTFPRTRCLKIIGFCKLKPPFSCYPLVMTNSLPWYRWPQSKYMVYLGLPAYKKCDFPWQTVSHNQMVFQRELWLSSHGLVWGKSVARKPWIFQCFIMPYGSKHCLRRYLALQIIVNYTPNTSLYDHNMTINMSMFSGSQIWPPITILWLFHPIQSHP